MALRALLRRQHEVSADAPSQEGAQRCFERRWRRGTGAASTPCLGRMAVWIAPNRGSPRAWASAPSCGARASPQPMLHRQQGATSGFEARWRRGAGADGTPCSGRTAPKIAPNRGSPRAWASAPSCGARASPQPMLHRQQGATSGFEARWRRGAGADGTPCCGRMAPKIAPNSGRPRAWASEPSCGGGASPQPTLLAGRAPRGALTGAGGAARARRAHLA